MTTVQYCGIFVRRTYITHSHHRYFQPMTTKSMKMIRKKNIFCIISAKLEEITRQGDVILSFSSRFRYCFMCNSVQREVCTVAYVCICVCMYVRVFGTKQTPSNKHLNTTELHCTAAEIGSNYHHSCVKQSYCS